MTRGKRCFWTLYCKIIRFLDCSNDCALRSAVISAVIVALDRKMLFAVIYIHICKGKPVVNLAQSFSGFRAFDFI